MEDEVISVELDRTYTDASLSVYNPIVSDETIDLTVSSIATLDGAITILQKE